MTDQELMQSIRTKWGAAIDAACDTSNVPPAFVAALIANESGGNADAKRFEKGVLASLWEVLLGRKTAYGSVVRADLVSYVSGVPGTPFAAPATLPADAFQRVDGLATSWGLTQVMGYHILEPNVGHSMGVDALKAPNTHLAMALRLLAEFAHEFQLDVTTEFEQLFRCWNSGQPDGATFDPKYIPNGLARMKIYADILANETDPGT